MSLTQDELSKLLHLLAHTRPQELDCTEVLHRVAGAVEALACGSELRPELEAVMQHLAVCDECREEADALRRILEDE